MNVIEQKFVEKTKKTEQNLDFIVNDAVLLLEDHALRERNVLKAIGLSAEIDEAERALEDKIIRTKHRDEYGKTVIHIDEIKEMCIKYRLDMQHTTKFRGKLPKDLPFKLKNFIEEKGIVLGETAKYNDFYIIAPPKMFSDYQTLGQIINDSAEYAGEQRKLRAIKNDPLLVFKLPENPNHYLILESWGKDFSWIRRTYGFFTTKRGASFLVTAFRFLVLGVLLALALGAFYNMMGREVDFVSGVIVVLSFLFGAAAIVASVIWMWVHDFCDARKHLRKQLTTRFAR